MSETATHKTKGDESTLGAISTLSTLDLESLSFIQLKRLQKVLQQASRDVEAESARRAELDNSGDTVKVPSPKL